MTSRRAICAAMRRSIVDMAEVNAPRCTTIFSRSSAIDHATARDVDLNELGSIEPTECTPPSSCHLRMR